EVSVLLRAAQRQHRPIIALQIFLHHHPIHFTDPHTTRWPTDLVIQNGINLPSPGAFFYHSDTLPWTSVASPEARISMLLAEAITVTEFLGKSPFIQTPTAAPQN